MSGMMGLFEGMTPEDVTPEQIQRALDFGVERGHLWVDTSTDPPRYRLTEEGNRHVEDNVMRGRLGVEPEEALAWMGERFENKPKSTSADDLTEAARNAVRKLRNEDT